MKTAQELGALVGQRGALQVGGFSFFVEVRDAKNAYGNARILVEPVNGSGSEWVAVERVRLLGSVCSSCGGQAERCADCGGRGW